FSKRQNNVFYMDNMKDQYSPCPSCGLLHRTFHCDAWDREDQIKLLKGMGPGTVVGQTLTPLKSGLVEIVLTRAHIEHDGRRRVLGSDKLICYPATPRDQRVRTKI